MGKLQWILCRLGRHKWEQITVEEYDIADEKKIEREYTKCSECDKYHEPFSE